MKQHITLALILLLSIFMLTPLASAQDNTPPTITIITPERQATVNTTTPLIEVTYTDEESGIDVTSITFVVDGIDVTSFDETEYDDTSLTYRPPELLRLEDGNHTVQLSVADNEENTQVINWEFYVDTTLQEIEEEGIDLFTIIYYILLGSIIVFIAFILYILYLKKTKNFTFHKYFIQHPVQKEYIAIYLPLVIAFTFTILSLAYVTSTPDLPQFSLEYVIVIGIFIGVTPYAIDSQLERRLTLKYERAFSQFLFEMADAMRGGLDPTKAIIELAKTETGVLKHHIQRAADNIKLGRPFDEVMGAMVRPIKSDLIQRYARLIGETSKVGGETAQVIHRTAKDMDDFIKINQERRRQLTSQVTTIYIAFAVLLVVLYQLITMFPSLGNIDIGLLGTSDIESAGQGANLGAQMSVLTMKRRFFHLVLINSFGTGLIIGEFIEGKIKFGLVHSLIMITASVLFFAILIL